MSVVGTKIDVFGHEGTVITHQSSMITVEWSNGEKITAHQSTWRAYGIDYQGPSLAKDNPVCGLCMVAQPGDMADHWAVCRGSGATVPDRLPRHYPLTGHRQGLKANDLISLASAFRILAVHRGTAYTREELSA